MRRLLTSFLLAGSAFGGIANIAGETGYLSGGSSSVPTLAVTKTFTAGHGIIIRAIGNAGITQAISDTNGQTFVLISSPAFRVDTSGAAYSVWYVKSSVAGADTITVTFGSASSFSSIGVASFSGLDTVTTYDAGALTHQTGIGNADVSSGNFTTTAIGDLIYAFGNTYQVGGVTAASGYTSLFVDTTTGAGDAFIIGGAAGVTSGMVHNPGVASTVDVVGVSFLALAPPFNLTPVSGQQGHTLNVTISAGTTTTHFVNGQTVASTSGSGITINSTTVSSSTAAVVNLTISRTAALTARDFIMTTGAEVVTNSGAFTVIAVVPISCASSGLWSATGTWTGGVVPGDDEIANIIDGCTVTVNDDRTIGTSDVAGTVAITLNASGALVVASGGTMHARGAVRATGSGSGPGPTQLSVQGGGTWEWDASQAVSPSTAIYTYSALGAFQYTALSFSGSSGSHATVRSNAAGANGRFVAFSNTAPALTALYADFLRVGDATHSSFDINQVDSTVVYNVNHSTWSACGTITNTGGAGVPANGTFIHDNNVHSGSQGAQVFHNVLTDNVTTGSGTREVKGNVFDVAMADTFYPGGFTILANYFGDVPTLNQQIWTSWTNNFVRYNPSTTNILYASGAFSNTYVFIDSDAGNPHLIQGCCYDVTGIIVGQAGTTKTPPGTDDSGEFYFLTNAGSPTAAYAAYNIILPNMAGYSIMEMDSPSQNDKVRPVTIDHNTVFSGWTRGASTITTTPSAFDLGESQTSEVGVIGSFRSNLIWNPQIATYTSGFFKIGDQAATPTVDPCLSSTCDYNGGWGYNTTATGGNVGSLTAGAILNGYAIKLTTGLPGTHDVNANPQFVCSPPTCFRSAELYPNYGLGLTASAWVSGASLSIGDIRSYAVATVYWGLTAHYRYQNVGTCSSSTTTAPGMATQQSRDCWEWRFLGDMRTDIAANGITSSYNASMMHWVSAGLTPTNIAFRGTGYLGTDIGAVPMSIGGVAGRGAVYGKGSIH